MTVDLYQLDSIVDDYDAAIEALDSFMDELMTEFVETPECMAYLATYPEMEDYLGNWIYHLLYYGYTDRAVTLPHMQKTDVESIVTELFPRKIVLQSSAEADYTIPELSAFWQFLQRVYQHPQAAKVLALLKQLQPKFLKLMNDPSKFGIGKSLMVGGITAGFDMTSAAGVEAYQQEYNQNLQSTSRTNLDTLIENLGKENTAGLEDFISALVGKIPINGQSVNAPLPTSSVLNLFRQELQVSMWHDEAGEVPTLSTQEIDLLKQQSLAATAPGTILTDFQTLLDFVGDDGIVVSNSIHTLPLKSLADLNRSLSQPIDLALQRPVQQSYPAIDGLYLILRASGLGEIRNRGKKYVLVINPELLTVWQSFNLTERYFLLLETWLVRVDPSILGSQRRSINNECSKCLQYWSMMTDPDKIIASYEAQKTLNYFPELHNIALLEMFGFLKLDAGKPEAGKGWRIEHVYKLPFGDAMMTAIYGAFMSVGMYWRSEADPDLPFAELQPTFQPYFPEWQRTF